MISFEALTQEPPQPPLIGQLTGVVLYEGAIISAADGFIDGVVSYEASLSGHFITYGQINGSVNYETLMTQAATGSIDGVITFYAAMSGIELGALDFSELVGVVNYEADIQAYSITSGSIDTEITYSGFMAEQALGIIDGVVTYDGHIQELPEALPENYINVVQSGGNTFAYTGYNFDDITESVAAGDIPLGRVLAVMSEILVTKESLISSGEFNSSLFEKLDLTESFAFIFRNTLIESMLVGDGMAINTQGLIKVIDALLLGEVAISHAEATQIIISAIAFADIVQVRLRESVTEGLLAGDSIDHALEAAAAMIEGLLMADDANNQGSITIMVSDALNVGEALNSTAEAFNMIREGAGLAIHMTLDTGQYVAWSVNTESKHLGKYTNYPFNSMAGLGGRYFGALDDGIYALEGDNDDGTPISSKIRGAMSNLGTGALKRMSSAYVGMEASGDMLLKMLVNNQSGAKETHVYRFKPRSLTGLREGRVKIGKGLKSVYWGFELENVDGSNFALDQIEFLPMVLEKRIQGTGQGE